MAPRTVHHNPNKAMASREENQTTPKGGTSCDVTEASHCILFPFLLLVLCIICYSNSLRNGFCFDDNKAILKNLDLRSTTPLYEMFYNDFWGTPMNKERSHKSYRPLCVLTFRLNYAIHALHPMGYHLFNVMCHWILCVLIMNVFQLFLSEWLAFILAVLFMVHPVHTEAVTGVVGRAELLSAIFMLLTVKAYVRGTKHHKATEWKFLNLAVVLVAIASLCKEQGITVVGICITYELFWSKKLTLREGLQLAKSMLTQPRQLPSWFITSFLRILYLVLCASGLMLLRILIMGEHYPKFPSHEIPASASPTPVRQLTQWYYLPLNVWLLLYPFPLLCDYTKGTISLVLSIADSRNLATISFIIALSALSLYAVTGNSKTSRQVTMALAFIVFPFLPASNLFFTVGFVIAERILYVPSLGFSMLVVIGLKNIVYHKRFKTIAYCGFALTLLLHSTKTVRRNIDWTSHRALFKSGLHITVNNSKLWSNVGHTYHDAGNHQVALAYYRQAAACDPRDVVTWINVGKAYQSMNIYSSAMENFSKAESLIQAILNGTRKRLSPSYLAVYVQMANLMRNESRNDEAIQLYQKAIKLWNEYEVAYHHLGDLYMKTNQLDKAEECYKKVLEFEPRSRDGLYNTAVVAFKKNRTEEAISRIEMCLEIYPNFRKALHVRNVLRGKIRGTDELERLLELLSVTPDDYQTMTKIGIIYREQRDLQNSEKYLNEALTVNDTYDIALLNLASTYKQLGEYEKALNAVNAFNKVVKDDVSAWKLLCELQINHFKNVDAAWRALEEAYKLSPDSIHLKNTFCILMFYKGEYKNAKACFEKLYQETEEEFVADGLRAVNTRIAKIEDTHNIH